MHISQPAKSAYPSISMTSKQFFNEEKKEKKTEFIAPKPQFKENEKPKF